VDKLKGKIVIACDKYKGNLTVMQVCTIIKNAIMNITKDIEIIVSPMADGGEGIVSTLVESYKGRYVEFEVTGSTGKKVKSSFGLIENGNTAVIEMSSASGLWLVKPQDRNPLYTTTYGTGELIKKALEIGAKRIIIGIGGSATNDAGIGAARALGVKFYDKNKNMLSGFGKDLARIESICVSDLDSLVNGAEIFVACDVDNPLYGPNGAAFVYGPQKGADVETVKMLDEGLRNFAGVVKRDLKKDVGGLKGAGAAGGLGAGLVTFLNAELKSGTDIIIQVTHLEDKIKDADLVITGEGAMDNQTFYGKSAYGVAMLAKKYNIPVITVNGSVNIDYDKIEKQKQNLFAGNFDTVTRDMCLEDAIKNGKDLLYFMSKEIAKFYVSIISKSR